MTRNTLARANQPGHHDDRRQVPQRIDEAAQYRAGKSAGEPAKRPEATCLSGRGR
ncbi:MAG: hypothetical protein OXH09_00480 [Gammaproteobacteria bacterium]|nr:hypothetical protein [Gammaproteobacteria bacterium]